LRLFGAIFGLFWAIFSPFFTLKIQKLCRKSPRRFQIFEKNFEFFQTPSKFSRNTFWTPQHVPKLQKSRKREIFARVPQMGGGLKKFPFSSLKNTL